MELEEKELADIQNEEADAVSSEKEPKEPLDKGDDGDKDIGKPDKAEKVDYKKLNARETVRDAFNKQKEKEAKDTKTSDKSDKQKVEKFDKEEQENTIVPKEQVDKLKDSKPPAGFTKAGKAKWDSVDPDIKESILKREKEVSDGFAQYGKSTKELDEINTLFAPREQELQKLGVSKAQLIGTFFQWADALVGPNKLNAWIQLGKNYGISEDTLRQRYAQGNQTPNTNQATTQQPNAEIAEVKNQVNQLNQRLANQQQAEADNFLATWSADKPHYSQVKQTMLALFQSGQVKLASVKDLDEAYDRACYADPAIRTQLREAEAVNQDKANKEAAAKKEADRLARLQKARSASSSIKSGSPASPSGNTPKSPTKNVSVGESLRLAIQEIRAD